MRYHCCTKVLLGLSILMLGWSLLGALPAALADNQCKPATGPQSKCTKDAQCCAGLVCDGAGGGGQHCQLGCHINGQFVASGTPNPTNTCQSCQPTVSTTAWTNLMNGTSCSDGNACTLGDACQHGSCHAGTPKVCTASDQCHIAGTCDPTTGACSNPPAPNGTACTDFNACTRTDTCQSGTCTGSAPVVCTALDDCHNAGTCDTATGECSNPVKANGVACTDDGNACTNDVCIVGACTHQIKLNGTPCTDAACDEPPAPTAAAKPPLAPRVVSLSRVPPMMATWAG